MPVCYRPKPLLPRFAFRLVGRVLVGLAAPSWLATATPLTLGLKHGAGKLTVHPALSGART